MQPGDGYTFQESSLRYMPGLTAEVPKFAWGYVVPKFVQLPLCYLQRRLPIKQDVAFRPPAFLGRIEASSTQNRVLLLLVAPARVFCQPASHCNPHARLITACVA